MGKGNLLSYTEKKLPSKNSYHSLRVYYVEGSLVSALYTFSHLTITIILKDECSEYLSFTDEATKLRDVRWVNSHM